MRSAAPTEASGYGHCGAAVSRYFLTRLSPMYSDVRQVLGEVVVVNGLTKLDVKVDAVKHGAAERLSVAKPE